MQCTTNVSTAMINETHRAVFLVQVGYDLDRSTTHLKFETTGVRTHDFQITDNTFHIPETLVITTKTIKNKKVHTHPYVFPYFLRRLSTCSICPCGKNCSITSQGRHNYIREYLVNDYTLTEMFCLLQ